MGLINTYEDNLRALDNANKNMITYSCNQDNSRNNESSRYNIRANILGS